MKRKKIPSITQKKIYQEARMICPFCGEEEVTTFEIHHIKKYSEEKSHDEENLILVCSSCHSKITNGVILMETVVFTKQRLKNGKHDFLKTKVPGDAKSNIINLSETVNNGVLANSITFRNSKQTIKLTPPENSIAQSLAHKNYLKHLVDCYHNFKKAEMKDRMNFTVIYQAIIRKFGAKWDMIPVANFDDVVLFMQKRIDDTILGKIQKSKGQKRYSTFVEFKEKYKMDPKASS